MQITKSPLIPKCNKSTDLATLLPQHILTLTSNYIWDKIVQSLCRLHYQPSPRGQLTYRLRNFPKTMISHWRVSHQQGLNLSQQARNESFLFQPVSLDIHSKCLLEEMWFMPACTTKSHRYSFFPNYPLGWFVSFHFTKVLFEILLLQHWEHIDLKYDRH